MGALEDVGKFADEHFHMVVIGFVIVYVMFSAILENPELETPSMESRDMQMTGFYIMLMPFLLLFVKVLWGIFVHKKFQVEFRSMAVIFVAVFFLIQTIRILGDSEDSDWNPYPEASYWCQTLFMIAAGLAVAVSLFYKHIDGTKPVNQMMVRHNQVAGQQ